MSFKTLVSYLWYCFFHGITCILAQLFNFTKKIIHKATFTVIHTSSMVVTGLPKVSGPAAKAKAFLSDARQPEVRPYLV